MKMKKFIAMLLISASVLALAGCGSEESSAEDASVSENSVSVEGSGWNVLDFDANEYVTLGEYTNLNVNYIVPTVADEDVEMYAMEIINDNTEYSPIEGRAAQNGDYISINFTGTLNGEEFEGGSAEEYEFVLGNEEFLADFETNLVGKNAGESFTFKMTFPEDYDEELGGKEVEFSVTINSISEAIVPEYTDEFVKEVTGYETIEEYETSIREELLYTAEEENAYVAAEEALYLAVENATVNGYPEALYDACYAETESSYQEYAEMFGMELEQFMTELMEGQTLEDVTAEWVKEILVTQAIAQAEGLTLSQEDYLMEVEVLAAEYGYDTVEQFVADYGEVSVATTFVYDNVINFLYASSNVTEVTDEATE